MDPHKLWTRIDRSDVGLHATVYSTPCFYYLVHTNEGFEVESNQEIINFKIKLEDIEKSPGRKYWKERSIDNLSLALACWLNDNSNAISRWGNVALVPMPTSRPGDHEYYDSRLVRLCENASKMNGLVRVENILDSKKELVPAHEGGPRDLPTLKGNLVVRSPSKPLKTVILVDDLMTSGNHYAACYEALKACFPDTDIIGLFLARHKYV